MNSVADIRDIIIEKYRDGDFVVDRTGAKTIEVIGATFLADEDWIIRKPNTEYIQRELEWYQSMSLYVDDIPGETPKIWQDIASTEGKINSNYGYLVWSHENGNQFDNVYKELKSNPNSRRAVMIYNRPSMHTDYCKDGMNDFICTYANTFMIRDNKLVSHYIMRSNDAVFGYNNDVAWARFIQGYLASKLEVEVGALIWTATNFHVYERHFKFIEEVIQAKKNEIELDAREIMRKRSEALAIAMLGKESANKWWNSRNKEFDMETPEEMWAKDHRRVYSYLMSYSNF